MTKKGKRPTTIDAFSRALHRITHQLNTLSGTLTTDCLKQNFDNL